MPEVPGVRERSKHLQRSEAEHDTGTAIWLFSPRYQGRGGSQDWHEGDPAWKIRFSPNKVAGTQNREEAEPSQNEPASGRQLQSTAGKQSGQPTNPKLPSSGR